MVRNVLAIDGGATTVRIAVLLVAPVPPSVEVIAPVVLLLLPPVVPVTSTEKVHDDPAAGDAVNVPPDRLMVPLLAAAVIVPLPQEPVTLGVAATTTPPGKLSVKPTALSALAVFELVMVKLSVLLAFNATLAGLKALLMVGGAITVMLAEAVLPVMPPASVAVTFPEVLLLSPAVVPVTFIVTVQDAPGARLAPERLTVDAPSGALPVPLQVVLTLPGVATTSPAGNVSLAAIPFSVVLLLVLLKVKIRLVVPFSGMEATPKTLAMVGGLMTVRSGLVAAVLPSPASVDLMRTVLW